MCATYASSWGTTLITRTVLKSLLGVLRVFPAGLMTYCSVPLRPSVALPGRFVAAGLSHYFAHLITPQSDIRDFD
jgi:hypothetical protein